MINLEGWHREDIPYRHFTNERFFSEELSRDFVNWLENEAYWHRHFSDFFDQFETHDVLCKETPLYLLLSKLPDIRKLISKLYCVSLSEKFEVSAHRLVSGQAIGVHTDAPRDNYETHRLVVILPSLGLSNYDGSLVLLDQEDWKLSQSIIGYPPSCGQGFIFSFSETSFHAVSQITQGVRYSLVFSFWESKVPTPQINTDQSLASSRHQKSRSAIGPLYDFIQPLEGKAKGMEHSGGSLISHLVGTYELLRSWHATADVCLAGLYHSVFGTQEFPSCLFRDKDRPLVKKIIGDRAEELAYRYSTIDKMDLRTSAFSRLETFIEEEEKWDSDFRAILLIDLANEVEQLPRIRPSTLDVWYIYYLSNKLKVKLPLSFNIKEFSGSKTLVFPKDKSFNKDMTLKDLGETFSDHIVRLKDSNDSRWIVEVIPKCVIQEARDPNFESSISDLAISIKAPSCSIGLLATSQERPEYVMFNHTMSLVVWSAYFGKFSGSLPLFHLDAHSDLGSPTAEYIEGAQYCCPITGDKYDLKNELDVQRIIRDGYINIGNFIVPAIASGWISHFYYVCQQQKEPWTGVVETYVSSRKFLNRKYPVVKARFSDKATKTEGVLRSIPAMRLPAGLLKEYLSLHTDVLVDVDLDFFCNRYDNQNTCWCENCDPPSVSNSIASINTILDQSKIRIALTTWAFSPGFCDSRYWSAFLFQRNVLWM